MGKAALIAIAAFTLIGAYYGMSSQRGFFETDKRLAVHQHEVVARNAALAGYNRAKQVLVKNFAATTLTDDYVGGQYTTTVSISGNEASIVSKGIDQTSSGSPVSYTVYAKVKKEGIYHISQEAPPFMQYALLSELDLDLDGNMDVDTFKVEGLESARYNANVHSNRKLTVIGNAASVRGFGTYKHYRDVKRDDVFRPYYNPASQPVVSQVINGVDIPFAAFNPEAIAMKLVSEGIPVHTSGDTTISGTIDFAAMGATREKPHIWHVKGSLSTSGNVRLNGYVMFLVNNDILFNGSVETVAHQGPNENNHAFYAGHNVDVGGSAGKTGILSAQVFAKNDVFLHGTPQIYGNVTAGNMIDVVGTPNVYYYPASPALTKFWNEPEIRLTLVSYLEGERIEN